MLLACSPHTSNLDVVCVNFCTLLSSYSPATLSLSLSLSLLDGCELVQQAMLSALITIQVCVCSV
jgi:hypothetical protein